MSERKAVVKNADMSEEMQGEAIECATAAMEKYVCFAFLCFSVLFMKLR